jgi:integrase
MLNAVRIPKPSKHKTGQAVVRLNGKDHYLGRYGSAQARANYEGLISRWLAHGRCLLEHQDGGSVNDLMLAYIKHAEGYYRPTDGKKSAELECLRDALKILKSLHGRTAAVEFGPKKLKAVRATMVEKGWCRTYVNHQVDRVRRMFRWAVSEELVSGDLYHALQAVAGLRRGLPGVRESNPVRPVPQTVVGATLPFMPAAVQAMVQLQLLTGARPGEVCRLRALDLDMSGRVWVYRPGSDRGKHGEHKTAHHGHERLVYLGPQAQLILRPWLRMDLQAYLFSPAESERARNDERRRIRRSPMTPSQSRRRPKRHPARAKRDRYDVASYRRAITRACETAFPLPEVLCRQRLPDGKKETRRDWQARLSPEQRTEVRAWRREHHWHPHQLRHSAATNLRKEFGVELARIILGHKTAFTTEIYAEADRAQAVEVMARIG